MLQKQIEDEGAYFVSSFEGTIMAMELRWLLTLHPQSKNRKMSSRALFAFFF